MKHGEIITLGRHRLMCGDATNSDDVMKLLDGAKIDLVLTDLPYGINIQHNNDGQIGGTGWRVWGGREKFKDGTPRERIIKTRPVIHGDKTTETARKNYEIIENLTPKKIIWGGNYFTDFLPPCGGWIFWDKERPRGLDFGSGELAYNSCSKVIKKYTQKSNGAILAGNKTLNPMPRLHCMQKPVELHAEILKDFSEENNNILDCFGGSGTTLIACEITNRNCFMMEISPEYCGIIRERYEKLKEAAPLFS